MVAIPRTGTAMQSPQEPIDWRPSGPPARWYEWLLVLLLLGLVSGVRAESVYKCEDGHGAVAYQAQPCRADQRTSTLELAAAPAYAPPPQYRLDSPGGDRVAHGSHLGRVASAGAFSWECRVSDGQMFYRHSQCPHSLPAEAKPAGGKIGGKVHSGGRNGNDDNNRSLQVTSRRISREEACRQIHSAGAIGRAGHQHDEDVSTYERNLGRDPCR
jgi:hypothetical protein